jgi:hypothetical protein
MAAAQHQQPLSASRALAGRGVLLTGATGYVGRLVLERLLRCCPDVAAVHVLVRPGTRRSTAAEEQQAGGSRSSSAASRERVVRLLTSSGLFNAVPPAQLRKIHVVEGQLSQPGLGLSEAQVAALAASVDVVLHAAGAVELDAGGLGGAAAAGGIGGAAALAQPAAAIRRWPPPAPCLRRRHPPGDGDELLRDGAAPAAGHTALPPPPRLHARLLRVGLLRRAARRHGGRAGQGAGAARRPGGAARAAGRPAAGALLRRPPGGAAGAPLGLPGRLLPQQAAGGAADAGLQRAGAHGRRALRLCADAPLADRRGGGRALPGLLPGQRARRHG